MTWSHGVYNFHAVDNDTLYITSTNRGLNFFTDGISGHKEAPDESIEQGLVNGTIYAIELKNGNVKWKIDTEYPPPGFTHDLKRNTLHRLHRIWE